MRLTISTDGKKAVETPECVIAQPQVSETVESSTRSSSMKKRVILGVVVLISFVSIVLVAILIGVWMFTEAEKEILQYTYNLDENRKQDVVIDPNTNTVQYHMDDPETESWIVEDYNMGVSVTKTISKTPNIDPVCYVTPLNKSKADNFSDNTNPINPSSNSVVYSVGSTPIHDTSFLPSLARDMCQGLPVYWMHPSCADTSSQFPHNSTMTPSTGGRDKRYIAYISRATITFSNGLVLSCVNSCCMTVCDCYVTISLNYNSATNKVTCSFQAYANYGGCHYSPPYVVAAATSGMAC